ncbi:single-strand DNA-binding protein [Salinibacterium sp. CAN_S4]|uniref:single-stranded DNA-binding protein n=1 Tax=Salinibacterium sp. CAN_S4 TaxID=2787727 RepID=UPI0018F05877
MSTKIPVTIEGNLTADPEHGTSENQVDYARFSVAVNDRRLNEQTNKWEDAGTVFHRVVVFNEQARHVVGSLRKGDQVLVAGDLRFGTFTDKDENVRESRDIVADTVGASLRFATVNIERAAPKASGPNAYAEGPVATPAATGAGFAR